MIFVTLVALKTMCEAVWHVTLECDMWRHGYVKLCEAVWHVTQQLCEAVSVKSIKKREQRNQKVLLNRTKVNMQC